MKVNFGIAVTIISGLLFLSSCNEKENDKVIDISSVDLTLDIHRYDRIFFEADTLKLLSSLESIRAKDSTFFDFYTIQMMNFGAIDDTLQPVLAGLNHFFTNPYVQGLYDTVQNHYPDNTIFEQELTDAMRHFNYYFPEKEIPEIYTTITEFSYNAASYDSTYLIFGLDMYLGKDYMYYTSFDFPLYMINRFSPEFLVPNGMEVMYNLYFGPDMMAETDALLHAMIENGKKLYFLECMMPLKERNLLIGYTPEQLAWCEQEEDEIWRFYNEHDLFYSKNYMEHKKHVNDGPFTAGMPDGAPGNVGSWVGWQIVNQYMKNADGMISLTQLLDTDAETIMTKSKYKPK
ncbi:MAG: hypothetical protein ACPG4Z_00085 [Chitinophagales bacterium]